ncbi:nuclear transport factor 2 family protein [Gordonia hydrophobica]|uniref:Nuclear transport factor 2 family protein n=1 Tax=Gordonia hydrophobica TaxID=40516 RepID=A0ABZ2U5J7_9ACTN|nr:nuclear transport factor 2 family protein [Gordonia hydrophobica]MBM7368657.1 hypothetical protein [Gordonia hydrophobica]
MVTFSQAVVAKDLDAVEDMLADDVVFTSPVAHKPYPGKAITISILRAVVEVFDDFQYVREIHDDGGREHAYVFTATVDGWAVTGCDFLTLNEDGKIVDFMVMVRPLKAAQALSAAMGARFADIQANAVAWMQAHQGVDRQTRTLGTPSGAP